jgi:molybdenum cofactor cytidylyltransferase
MGQLKQLLPIHDKPIIRHCLDNLIAAGIQNIIVVLCPQAHEVVNTIRDIPVQIVFNREPKSEMAESVRIGLHAIDDSSSGVIVSLSDHPLVTIATLKRLVHCYLETPDKIIIPLYKGKRGHPTIFPRHIIEKISEGGTLRDIINRDHARLRFLDVQDEGVILDIDTKEDYKRILKK